MLPHLHGYVISAHGCLRGSSQLLTLYGNQEASLGAGMLDGRAHKPVEKFSHTDRARERLGNSDPRGEIELFARCFDRACRPGRARVPPQPRMELLELPHLAVGSPA